jgi:hypothetical protein
MFEYWLVKLAWGKQKSDSDDLDPTLDSSPPAVCEKNLFCLFRSSAGRK